MLFSTGILLAMGGWATAAGSATARSASIVSPFVLSFLLAGHGGASALFGLFAVMALVGLVAIAVGGIETRGRALEELAR